METINKTNKAIIIKTLKQLTGFDMSDCFKNNGKLKKTSKNPETRAMLLGFRSINDPYLIDQHFISMAMTDSILRDILGKFMEFNKHDFINEFNAIFNQLKKDQLT
jgi:hypothetical protein